MLGHRAAESRAAGDRRRGGCEQDQRAREPYDNAKRIDEGGGQVPLERRHDSDDRRLKPLIGEVRRAVFGRERSHRHHRDQHGHNHDKSDR